jgi:hypothetical protein
LLSSSSGLIALMVEAASTSETLVNFYQTTWRYNAEDSHLHPEEYFLNIRIGGMPSSI